MALNGRGRTALERRFFRTKVFLSLALGAIQLLPLTAPYPGAPLAIAATTSEAEEKGLGMDSPRLVLKGAEQFLVLDNDGMIAAGKDSPYGLYQDDTRFLSQWQIALNGQRLHPLTAITKDGYTGTFLYGNAEGADISPQSLLITRELLLHDGFNERLTLESFVNKPQKLNITLTYDSDFHDMFEVRGQKRPKRGEKVVVKGEGKVTATYTGLDKSVVTTTIACPRTASASTESNTINFLVDLPARGKQTLEFAVTNTTATRTQATTSGRSYQEKKDEADALFKKWQQSVAQITTDNAPVNRMIEQAGRDIFLLRQATPKGPCLSAGLPWYAVAFGRDQAVAGLQMLTFAPHLSKEILHVLAAYQGTKYDAFTEEEPGRILHELRLGEMARCREIPFIPFYGTIDATPLWLILVNRYTEATGDMETAKTLWPNIERALSYLEKASASTNGGFLYYGGKGASALSNQCWKDSGDSIMYKDGNLAKQPIATCEVQGYLYQALSSTARLAADLGHDDVAKRLTARAAELKQSFQKHFWLSDRNFVALALDGEGKPCTVVSSNPGHLLSTGILEPSMQDAVVARLMQNDMFSGWGIRTLSTGEVKYNPMSYHDGTVWPHDNAMTIEGMAATGHEQEACRVMAGLIDAAGTASDARLPELFCGFPRSQYDSPVPYPVSCVPQAWAAGSIFEMLKATLGIYPQAGGIKVMRPTLPPGVNHLTVKNMQVGGHHVTLQFDRSTGGQVVYKETSD
ncbi:MAG: amylo-alpha-1,6-glucosidase [Cyanobacteria bacterium SZAS TMP-1]|nr:amylo-alpha-1,6-glucosidase [Cyanobacteria bacterium SZAS TMP-1]